MTLTSDKYHQLKQQWANDVKVLEPDCHDWATLIEQGHSDDIALDKTIADIKNQGADVIVLGCTHYHWLKERIVQLAGPGVSVLEPSDAIGARLDSLLAINSILPE
jgi:glutamate racemase